MTVWNPETYLKYAGIRFRPALDLIEHIPLQHCERIFDLGCGTGHLTQALQATVAGGSRDRRGFFLGDAFHARGEFPKLELGASPTLRAGVPMPRLICFFQMLHFNGYWATSSFFLRC